MRLARDLGCWDVDRMLDGMSSQAFTEWLAFYLLENDKGQPRDPAADMVMRGLMGRRRG